MNSAVILGEWKFSKASPMVIHLDEGLIGFADHKRFVFLENPAIEPFRLIESAVAPEVGFVVVDPVVLVRDYLEFIPAREWDTVASTNPSKRRVFVTVSIAATPQATTANLQAPILVNSETMAARQVILTRPGLLSRYPVG
jgi:flagellar assembly factor FliW